MVFGRMVSERHGTGSSGVAGVAAAWGAAAASWRPVFVSRRRSGRGVGRRTPTTVNCSLNPSLARLADPRLICTRISYSLRIRYLLAAPDPAEFAYCSALVCKL